MPQVSSTNRVFVVSEEPYHDNSTIVAVFSTESAAEAYCEAEGGKSWRSQGYCITEVPLNEPLPSRPSKVYVAASGWETGMFYHRPPAYPWTEVKLAALDEVDEVVAEHKERMAHRCCGFSVAVADTEEQAEEEAQAAAMPFKPVYVQGISSHTTAGLTPVYQSVR